LFTGAGYHGAAALIGACGFIYVLTPQNRMMQDLIGFNKKTWIIASGALIMAVCSLSLNFYLVPRFGYIAAPYVFIVATLAQTGWLYGWVYRFERLHLHWGKAAGALAIFLGFVFLDQIANGRVGAKLLSTAIYAAITYGLVAPSMKNLRGDALNP
ncbi:MAG: hypothetical protein RIR21_1798, partial [Pseudomonadota bacterium]